MSDHAVRSPSGAAGWSRCSDWASDPTGSKYAEEGTRAHEVASQWLTGNLLFKADSDEMYTEVSKYYDYCGALRELASATGVEQRLDMSNYVEGCWGTADFVALVGTELVVVDLKYGRGIEVDALWVDENGEEQPNEQLGLYALGAYNIWSIANEIETVRMVIHQPRKNHVSEFSISVERLLRFARELKPALTVTPGEKQCRWCAKKGTCEALKNQVEAVVARPVSLNLADSMAKVDMVESWCKGVRAETERQLLSGNAVPGWKIVQGKKGNRAWADAGIAEMTLKGLRLRQDEMYTFNLISPTVAEKVLADHPRQWAKVANLITQSEGKPSVAPASDKRPAIDVAAPSVRAFSVIPEEALV
jgi:hypothetical protein